MADSETTSRWWCRFITNLSHRGCATDETVPSHVQNLDAKHTADVAWPLAFCNRLHSNSMLLCRRLTPKSPHIQWVTLVNFLKKRGPRGEKPMQQEAQKKTKNKKKAWFYSAWIHIMHAFCFTGRAASHSSLKRAASFLGSFWSNLDCFPKGFLLTRPPWRRPTCFFHVEARTRLFPEKECRKKTQTHTHTLWGNGE